MGKKGGSRHLKRMAAPSYWPIHTKEFKWVVKPRPGPHRLSRCLPLLLVLREVLGHVKTKREANVVLSSKQVKVDGKTRCDKGFPVGPMDVVEIPATSEAFRVLPAADGLVLHKIKKGEEKYKLCKIVGKKTVKRGHVQLSLHDGRNIPVKLNDPKSPQEDVFETSDVLKIRIPDGKVLEHIKFRKGVTAIVTAGKNVGKWGRVIGIRRGKGGHPTIARLEDTKGNKFQTTLGYTFAVGEEKSLISLPEEG